MTDSESFGMSRRGRRVADCRVYRGEDDATGLLKTNSLKFLYCKDDDDGELANENAVPASASRGVTSRPRSSLSRRLTLPL